MPRRGTANYQIDRRRTKKTKDEVENASSFDEEDPKENGSDEDYRSSNHEEINDGGDDSDDEVVVVSSKKARSTRASPANSKRKARKKIAHESSDEEEMEWKDDESSSEDEMPTKSRSKSRSTRNQTASDDDDDNEDFQPSRPSASKRRASRQPQPRRNKRARSSQKSVLEGFIVEDDDEVQQVETPPKRRTSRKRQVEVKQKDSSDEDEFTTDSEKQATRTQERSQISERRTPHRLAARTQNRQSQSQGSGSDSSDGDDVNSTSRRSSPRRAQKAATPSYKEVNSDGEEAQSLDSVQGDEQAEPLSPSKNTGVSSDEEFLDESQSEDSDEKEIFETDSDFDDDEESDAGHGKSDPVNIDNENIGSADESSDDNNDNTPLNQLATKAKAPRHINGKRNEIQPSGSFSSTSFDDEDHGNGNDRRQNSPPKLPCCPSTEDTITNNPLPRKHICYITPDGQSRQCFALETLRQIALQCTSLPFLQQMQMDESTTHTPFLQPPHFRTSMSDDLLDQIASRFGREALNIHGEFYNRKKSDLEVDRRNLEDGSSDEEYRGADMLLDDDFADRVREYMVKQMGSKDLYTCPLCYSEMHRRIARLDSKGKRLRVPRRNGDDDGESSIDDEDFLELPSDSIYDPMTVLGWLDNDGYEAAAQFCFAKVAELKGHLRQDHIVQTKGIQGNDLYHRFRIRAQDGLLQRFLHREWKKYDRTTFQGAMQSYWISGNNQTYIYLLDLVKQAKSYLSILDDVDSEAADRAAAEEFVKTGQNFFQEVQERSQKDWERISSPFTKSAAKEDLRDFLAEDGEGEEEDEQPHFLAHRQMLEEDDEGDPNSLFNKIQRKYADQEDSSIAEAFRNDEDESSEDDDVSVNSELNRNGFYSEEEEEEEDEWIDSIRKKKRTKTVSTPSVNTSKKLDYETPGKKLTRRKKSQSKAEVRTSTPSSRRLTITEDSDDDEF